MNISKIKSYLTIERIGFVVIILVLLFSLISTCSSNSDNVKQLNQAKQEVKHWKDENGNAHATIKTLIEDKLETNFLVDSISKVLDIKPKSIISYVQATAKIDTVIIPKYTPVPYYDTIWNHDTIVRIDTLPGYKVDYRDSSFLSIQGTVPSKEGLQVSLSAKLSFTEYEKRKWFLGKRYNYIDIGTDNPYISFENAQAYKRAHKSKLKIRPGIGIGVNYDYFHQKVNPGIQAGIYLIKD